MDMKCHLVKLVQKVIGKLHIGFIDLVDQENNLFVAS